MTPSEWNAQTRMALMSRISPTSPVTSLVPLADLTVWSEDLAAVYSPLPLAGMPV